MSTQTLPEFAIFQNSRTKTSAIWTKEQGKWKDCPESDFEPLALMARCIRTAPDPVEIVRQIQAANKNNKEGDGPHMESL